MRSVWAAALLLRRIRADRGSLALLLVVVATTSFLLAAAPRLLNRVTDDALRTSLRSVTSAERDVRVSQSARIPPGPGGGVSAPASQGDRLADGFPSTLAALVSGRTMVVTTVRLDVPQPPIDQTRLSLRYQDGLTEITRLVAGRWPESRGVPLQPGGFWGGGDGTGAANPPPVTVEAALSTVEARKIGVGVGDRLGVAVDETDPLVAGTPFFLGPTEVLVVGLFEPLDPNAADWSGDTSLLDVALTGSIFRPIMNATAYVSAAIYPDLFASGLPFRYEWRFHTDPDRL
ncbi:MAG TPA: hypothetical protein VJ506_04635, partial [Candidatus Limnocylindrales bacterium]|nr:hypothetical protein [Candidatus Limnocylindrales bacterium]